MKKLAFLLLLAAGFNHIQAQSITGVDPDTVELTVNTSLQVTGTGTNFLQATDGIRDIWLRNGNFLVQLQNDVALNDTVLTGDALIPCDYPAGLWDLLISDFSVFTTYDTLQFNQSVYVPALAFDLTVSVSATQLISHETVGTYQWIDCSDNSIVPGATDQSFTPPADGSYAVIVDKAGCVDTSACTSFFVGLNELSPLKSVSVYPNPTQTNINVDLGTMSGADEIVLTDLRGKTLVRKLNVNTRVLSLQMDILSRGAYLLQVRSGQSSRFFKVLKQ